MATKTAAKPKAKAAAKRRAQKRGAASESSEQAIDIAKRRADALLMRSGGATLQEIADTVPGYTDRSHVRRDIIAALDKTVREPANTLREVELERLDKMWKGLASATNRAGERYSPIFDGDILAIRSGLKIMERRAALLGLDAPRRKIIEFADHDEFMRVVGELEREVAELEGDGQVEGEPVDA